MIRKREAGSRKQKREAGSGKREAGSWKREAGSRSEKQEAKARIRKQKREAGSRSEKQEAGSRKQEAEAGSRKLEAGRRKREHEKTRAAVLLASSSLLPASFQKRGALMEIGASTISTPSRIKLFMALSRTQHGVLDMATPALAALFWLGTIPSAFVVVIGLITAFAGYTAVYALNDLVDYRTDRRKIKECGALKCSAGDLDAVYVRHPLALGMLSLREGIVWTAAWGALALFGAWLLNPACAVIFILGCIAETIYCLMLRLSWTRTLVSGAVKSAGGLAAIYAVAPRAPAVFLIGFFLWFFFWEIGAQNVPNDWSDLEEDVRMGAETIPVRFGPEGSAQIAMGCIGVAVFMSMVLFWLTPAHLSAFYFAGSIPAALFLLVLPGWKLYSARTGEQASALFNKASYYPVTMFVVILLSAIL
jgi:4-hydroxybenzoate polyprenyltransferase